MITFNRARALAGALLSLMLIVPATKAQAQGAVITGKVLSEFGDPLESANIFITELSISVPTNNQGVYTINIPAARLRGDSINLRVRAIGHVSEVRRVRLVAGTQTFNFNLKKDVNRLSEVVVTGTVEATEKSKVPFAVGRLNSEDLPVPALDPIRALQGKVAGMRIAQTSGQPGSSPEILMRGPTSINASGRSQGPLMIGGLDIESVEVVKGAAGASLYGTKAANGVIQIKTKRGNNQDGVKFNARTEYGYSDLNSLSYGMPLNSRLQLDETGHRFCVQGTGSQSACSRTIDYMSEILRINNMNADTTRTPVTLMWSSPAVGDGSLLNVMQATSWPDKYYNTFAIVATPNPTTLDAIDATGRVGAVRFYVSGQYTDDHGAIKGLSGQQQRRARVNLDYDVKSNWLVSLSTAFDKGNTDLHSFPFGTLLRGAPPGTNYAQRDTLGRYSLRHRELLHESHLGSLPRVGHQHVLPG